MGFLIWWVELSGKATHAVANCSQTVRLCYHLANANVQRFRLLANHFGPRYSSIISVIIWFSLCLFKQVLVAFLSACLSSHQNVDVVCMTHAYMCLSSSTRRRGHWLQRWWRHGRRHGNAGGRGLLRGRSVDRCDSGGSRRSDMSTPAAAPELFSLAEAAIDDPQNSQRVRGDPNVDGGSSAAAPSPPTVPGQFCRHGGRIFNAGPTSVDNVGRLFTAPLDASVNRIFSFNANQARLGRRWRRRSSDVTSIQ